MDRANVDQLLNFLKSSNLVDFNASVLQTQSSRDWDDNQVCNSNATTGNKSAQDITYNSFTDMINATRAEKFTSPPSKGYNWNPTFFKKLLINPKKIFIFGEFRLEFVVHTNKSVTLYYDSSQKLYFRNVKRYTRKSKYPVNIDNAISGNGYNAIYVDYESIDTLINDMKLFVHRVFKGYINTSYNTNNWLSYESDRAEEVDRYNTNNISM